MASGVRSCSPVPVPLGRSRVNSSSSEVKKYLPAAGKKPINCMAADGPRIYFSNSTTSTLLLLESIQKKIVSFRDILDLPDSLDGAPIMELLVRTAEDLNKLFPGSTPPSIVEKEQNVNVPQALRLLCRALKSAGDAWDKKRKQPAKLQLGEVDLEGLTHDQLGRRVIHMLDLAAAQATEFLDLAEGGGGADEKMCADRVVSPLSPRTPTSVLPELGRFHGSPPRLWPLRLQAVGKLKPIDVKRLAFHASPQVAILGIGSPQQAGRDGAAGIDMPAADGKNCKNAPPASDASPAGEQTADASPRQIPNPEAAADLLVDGSPRPPPSVTAAPPALSPPKRPQKPVAPPKALPPLPPPPPPPTKVPGQQQGPTPPPALPSNGLAPPPPPPPIGMAKALKAKKSANKLKRSTHMGSLYRVLKGKMEGTTVLRGRPPQDRKNQVGGTSKGQGMADALAEMTKRSAYFRQIEEDVMKHGQSIIQLKAAITSFQTGDMNELIRFHQHVELVLESLTDESQVLSRFEEFPLKKLESIRMAASLHSKLEGVVANLRDWKALASAASVLEKIEFYFNKMKEEVDAIERGKEEESKRFKAHNINFDYDILTRIKELMVDLSSSCMEIVLKESRTERSAAAATAKTGSRGKMLWRAFQLAFRVYNFAGGQDDRADKLTRELAGEIQTSPDN